MLPDWSVSLDSPLRSFHQILHRPLLPNKKCHFFAGYKYQTMKCSPFLFFSFELFFVFPCVVEFLAFVELFPLQMVIKNVQTIKVVCCLPCKVISRRCLSSSCSLEMRSNSLSILSVSFDVRLLLRASSNAFPISYKNKGIKKNYKKTTQVHTLSRDESISFFSAACSAI